MAEAQSPTRKSFLQRKTSIISVSSIHSPTNYNRIQRTEIDRAITKFLSVDRSIDLDMHTTNFNLIVYEIDSKNEKNKFDPQMMTARLKQLENRAEIKRAQMEIDQRENKRRHVHKKQKLSEIQPYRKIYAKFLDHKELYEMPEHDSDDDIDHNQRGPEGILFYNHLKKHPKLLSFTMDRQYVKSKEKEIKQAKTARRIEKLINPEGKSEIQTYYRISEGMNNAKSQEHNPEKIVDSQYNKFFSKKRNDKLSAETKSIERCSRMLEKQSTIVNSIKDNHISKQNRKKLELRLNEIVNEIAKNQKSPKYLESSHISSFTLPKLNNSKNISLQMSVMGKSNDVYR